MAIVRTLPDANGSSPSGSQLPARTAQDLSAYAQLIGASNWTFADEGSYFQINNVLATGVAGHAAPVVADAATKPLLGLFNGTGRTLYPDYLFLEVTAAGTGGTIHYTTIYIDNKGTDGVASGGTAFTTFASTLSTGAVANTSGLTCRFGAVAGTMSSAVLVGQQIVREVIPVVQDTITMKFGGPNAGEHSSLTTAGTATNHCVQHFAPIAVRPGGNLNISQIRPSQSAAASYQFSFGFWLR